VYGGDISPVLSVIVLFYDCCPQPRLPECFADRSDRVILVAHMNRVSNFVYQLSIVNIREIECNKKKQKYSLVRSTLRSSMK
jgi:hypothetical protein